MLGCGYRAFMEKAGGAHLELKIDLGEELIEVRDLGKMLAGLANEYDAFVKGHFDDVDHEARFYVREVRKGSTIIDFVATAIGMMDQILILRQFYEVTSGNIKSLATGVPPKALDSSRKRHLSDMVKAVATSESGTMSLAFREREADGSEAALVISKGDAQNVVENSISNLNNLLTKAPEGIEEAGPPQRCLMQIWQHNQDECAAQKKKTGHKVKIGKFDPKPKPLIYENQEVAQELHDILDKEPYSKIIFDVTAAPVVMDEKLKSYQLVEIHQYFEDDETPPLIEA